MSGTKPFSISKQWVYDAYMKVKSNRGSGGVDGISLKEFDMDYKNHLYKLWNKISSGSYMPPPADRIGQTVVKELLELVLEPLFYEDFYGYRIGKSAIDAVSKARERCWKQSCRNIVGDSNVIYCQNKYTRQ